MRTLALVLAALTAGCATVGKVTNLPDPACRDEFVAQIASILSAEGETPDVAEALAGRTAEMLERMELGPRPFLVSSPSGADYEFFVQLKKSRCLLRLYGRRKGFMTYTNNITYIATRPLAACACGE